MLDIVGPETLSFADWLRRLRHAHGLPPTRLLHVPWRLAQTLAVLGHGLSPMLRLENLRMLRKGYLADPAALTQFLGRAPRVVVPEFLPAYSLLNGSAS
jgi:uncharacterized protein YbjT (DUF2867 family)